MQASAASPSLRMPRVLTTRFADFWLLGGASLVVWLVMFGTQRFRYAWAVDQHFKNLTVTTASLSLLINYPHFVISYKLAYSRGWPFIRRHALQLLVVPACLAAGFAWAYVAFDTVSSDASPLQPLVRLLGAMGDNGRLVSGPRVGDVLFGLTFNVMALTVGWHYTKQAFGCTMVYAQFDGYPLTPRQRAILKWSLLSVWWLNVAHGNTRVAQQSFSQFAYYTFGLPDGLVWVTAGVAVAGVGLTLSQVVWRNYETVGRWPGLNMAVPFVALYVWWLPVTRQQEFYLLLTPFFHSLQYLAFVYKMEHTRIGRLDHPEVRGTVVVLGAVLAGWLVFELIPNEVDTALGTFNAWKMFFFFTAATLFVNIHHYFIDNVLWRLKDPTVRSHLLD